MQWDAQVYDNQHSFVFKYGNKILQMLNPQAGERILDVGCGTAHLTQQIAETGAEVTGVDQSESMLEQARRLYPQLNLIHGDIAHFTALQPFDAVFSNATLHWVTEADAAAHCMADALRKGGRFVVEFGGKGNVFHTVGAFTQALQEITGRTLGREWHNPSIPEYTALLEKHGLEVTFAELWDRPTLLEGEDGYRNWLKGFRKPIVDAIPTDEEREAVLQRAEVLARPHLYRDGAWYADYRRLRIVAWKR